MNPLKFPNILGHIWSFASIEIWVRGQLFTGCTSINYNSSMEVGDVYGTRPQKLGTTRGKQNAEGSMEILTQEWERLRNLLMPGGVGYAEMRFQVQVQYGELLSAVKTDTLIGCRVVNAEYNNTDGTDGSTVTLTLNIMRIQEGISGRPDLPIGIAF